MNILQILRNFYSLLLNLYPTAYRKEYGDELQMVFDLSLDEAMKVGRVYVAGVLLREFFGLPEAIIHEHLRARRKTKMVGKFASRFDFPQGSRSEFLAVLASFFVPMAAILFVSVLINYFGDVPAKTFWLNVLFGVVFLGSFLGMLAVGLVAGVPRWFLPYLGFVLALINVFIHNGLTDPSWRGFPFLFQASRFIRGFIYEGLNWAGLIILIILLVLAVSLTPKFRPFYQRLREDWTLLTFVIYGTAPLAVILSFDEYKDEGPYILMAYLILAVGGWLYLRNHEPRKRFLILFIGLTLSMAVAAAGRWILFTPMPGFGFTKLTEVMGIIITWIWLALIILMPLAINLLPRAKSPLESIDLGMG